MNSTALDSFSFLNLGSAGCKSTLLTSHSRGDETLLNTLDAFIPYTDMRWVLYSCCVYSTIATGYGDEDCTVCTVEMGYGDDDEDIFVPSEEIQYTIPFPLYCVLYSNSRQYVAVADYAVN